MKPSKTQQRKKLCQELNKIMQSEIFTLREILGNIKEEQIILLYGNEVYYKKTEKRKKELQFAINKINNDKKKKIKVLTFVFKNKYLPHEEKALLSEIDQQEKMELGYLQQQRNSLLNEINDQQKYNTYLKEKKAYNKNKISPKGVFSIQTLTVTNDKQFETHLPESG